jgi:hypothetical protein
MLRRRLTSRELCAVRSDGVTAFSRLRAALDQGTPTRWFYAFDLLFVDGERTDGLQSWASSRGFHAQRVATPSLASDASNGAMASPKAPRAFSRWTSNRAPSLGE